MLRPDGEGRGLVRAAVLPAWRQRRAAIMIPAAFAGACLTGLLAQVAFRVPLSLVPVTGQVFAVLVCGALLGGRYGMLSQIIYVAFGTAGVPWFASGGSGLGAIFGPTAGYLFGFVAAAFFLGAVTDRYPGARTLQAQIKLMLVAVGIIYLLGVLYLMAAARVSFLVAVSQGALVFVPVDVLKVMLAALVTSRALRRTPRVAERDR